MIDLAHNEAGLEALLEIMAGVRRPGARLLLGLGAVGDRTDELIGRLGEIGAMGADVVAIGHKQQLPARPHRSRSSSPCSATAPNGSASPTSPSYATEVACLAGLVAEADPGDVVGLMCHAERQEVYAWLAEHGGTADTPRAARREGAGRPRLTVAAQRTASGSSSRCGSRSATDTGSSRSVGSAPGPGAPRCHRARVAAAGQAAPVGAEVPQPTWRYSRRGAPGVVRRSPHWPSA